ncbi:unnamed protein product [Meganyctiphanes norvegica]|uniref:Uncharacterized protein n=1 Tax=Meganyctiphanes norvegica TaxID=48144 RepID=A0AAV2SA13_MEGNR
MSLVVVMAETNCDMKSLFQEMLSADNIEEAENVGDKLTFQISHEAFFKLVSELMKLIFNARYINKNMILNPEKCSNSFIQLGLMSFKCNFLIFHYDERSNDYLMHTNILITISQLDVDKYISCLDGNLIIILNLIQLIHVLFDNKYFATSEAEIAITKAARKFKKMPNDFLNELYVNVMDLLAQLILTSIKSLEKNYIINIIPVSHSIVFFFRIYFMIAENILESGYVPFVGKSTNSSIAVMTNCILLFQAKLITSDLDSIHWSNIICRMEKLRVTLQIIICLIYQENISKGFL